MAVAGLLGEYGLWEKLKGYPRLDPRTDKHKGFDVEVYVAAFVFGFCSGGKSLADTERLNEDEALKAMLGMKRMPDQSALGEWLRNLGEDGVQELRRLVRDFCQWALQRAQPARIRHCGMLEAFFDDTQIEVEGKRFEGAKINYEGNVALSWQTLWVGPFLVDAIMGSPSEHKEPVSSDQCGNDVSAYLPMMLKENGALWQGVESYLYADSASSAGKYLEAIDGTFSRWSVSYNKWTGRWKPARPRCLRRVGAPWNWRNGEMARSIKPNIIGCATSQRMPEREALCGGAAPEGRRGIFLALLLCGHQGTRASQDAASGFREASSQRGQGAGVQ